MVFIVVWRTIQVRLRGQLRFSKHLRLVYYFFLSLSACAH